MTRERAPAETDYVELAARYGAPAFVAFRDRPAQAVLIGVLGGAMGFVMAGPYGAANGAQIHPGTHGPPQPTDEYRVYREPVVVAKPSSPEVEPAAAEMPWIVSKQAPRTEHLEAKAWVIEADGQPFGLAPGHVYRVGRDDGADIRIFETAAKGDTVSRQHAELGVFADGLCLSDTGSRNGTWVDDRQLMKGEVFFAKQRHAIRLGKFVLTVRPG